MCPSIHALAAGPTGLLSVDTHKPIGRLPGLDGRHPIAVRLESLTYRQHLKYRTKRAYTQERARLSSAVFRGSDHADRARIAGVSGGGRAVCARFAGYAAGVSRACWKIPRS